MSIHNNPAVPGLHKYFDAHYGQSMTRLIEDILENGIYCVLDPHRYPQIFSDLPQTTKSFKGQIFLNSDPAETDGCIVYDLFTNSSS